MIISIDAKKAIDKNPARFHDESTEETRNRKNVPQHTKIYI
jgi:hypothetical protein